jgi:hypothetical protein
MIDNAKEQTDIKEKQSLIREIETFFNTLMSSYPTIEMLVNDILKRIKLDN